jgi:hypothetical protein
MDGRPGHGGRDGTWQGWGGVVAAENPAAAEPARSRRLPHVQPLQLKVAGEKGLSRPAIFTAFAIMAAGLLITLLPARLDQYGLGDLTDGGGRGYVPALCFLAGDACLAAGVWRAAAAARNRQLERAAIFGLGALAASLTGRCLRSMMQLAVLRDFYRPALFFSGPARAAAVGWALLLTLFLLAGFLAPAAVALANLMPAKLAGVIPPARWLAARWSWLMWPFAALAAVVIVTQWVLPAPLAAAMGYRYLAPSGTVITFSLRDLGASAWTSLQVLFALPLVILMWEGIESARTCQRLVRAQDGGETRLLKALRRIDARIAAAAVILACGLLAVLRHDIPAGAAGIILLTVVSLSFTGQLGRAARLFKGFERGVRRWQLPEGWRDVGRFSLILAVLIAPVLGLLAGDIGRAAKSALWLPPDLSGFYLYWRDFNVIQPPSVTAAGLYGHVDSAIWITCFVLAGFLLCGMLIQGFRKGVRDGFPAVWFLLRAGVVALLLAPIARLADQPSATAILAGCAVAAVLLTFQRSTWPTAVWSVIAAGAALALWSFALWRLTWVPAAAMLGLTVIQRFVYNAGELNTASPFRSQRVAYFQTIALLSVAMLALGHGAAAGYFDSEELSSVSDRVSLSVVAVIWLIVLTAQQARVTLAKKGAVGEAGLEGAAPGPGERPGRPRITDRVRAGSGSEAEDLPASWSWMLNPELGLVTFIGREAELEILTAWAARRDAAGLRLVTGPGGSGKTRLALELCKRGREHGWTSTWVAPGQETGAVSALRSAPAGSALLVIDNAEARQGLEPVIARLAAAPGAGLRVLLLARSAGEWCRRLSAVSPAARDLVAAAVREKLALPAAVTPDLTDPQIVRHGVASVAREFGLRESRVDIRRAKVHKRQNILDLLAEALAATMADAELAETGTGTVPVDLRRHLDPLLEHEQEFWHDSARRAGLLDGSDGTSPDALRAAIAAGCLLGAGSVHDAAGLATRAAGIPASPELAKWLAEICAASRSWTTADGLVHPGRLAELLTIRELARSDTLSKACLASMTASRALRAVSFLARAVPDYTEAASLLSPLLADLDDRITDPRDAAQTLSAALSVLPEPGTALAPAAIALTRRLLTYLPADLDPAERSYWLGELSRWLSKAGNQPEAVLAADQAVTIGRELTAQPTGTNRSGRYLPSLDLSLENLAERLESHGDVARLHAVLGEAIMLTRELAAKDPGLYGPWLARQLVNLNAGARDARDPETRAAQAQEAVALYRQAVPAKPGLYEAELGRALEVLSLRHLDAGRPQDAASTGSEALAVYQNLLAGKYEQYRPNLARALDNQGVFLARAGRQAEALAAAQEAVSEYAKLQRTRPGQFAWGNALALEHLSSRYQNVGRSSRATAASQQAARLRAAEKK